MKMEFAAVSTPIIRTRTLTSDTSLSPVSWAVDEPFVNLVATVTAQLIDR